MPIKIKCPNGHLLAVKDDLAGKRIRCPKCEQTVLVPAAEDPFSGVFEVPINPSNMSDDGMPEFVNPGYVPPPTSEPKVVDSQNHQKRSSTAKLPKPENSHKSPQPQEKLDKNLISYYVTRIGIPVVVAVAIGSLLYWFGGSDKQITQGNIPQGSTIKTLPPTVVHYHNGAQDNQVELPKDAIIITRDNNGGINNQPQMPPVIQETNSQPDLNRDPQGLVSFPLGSNAIAYKLPSPSCSSAYDPETGILAFTDDTKGIVFHSIQDLLEGKTVPKHALSVDGLPGSLTMKQLKDQRLFVCTHTGASELILIDTKTLEVKKTIKFPMDFVFQHITSSLDPDDPYVYYTKYRRTSGHNYAGIGRIDLTTEKSEGTESVFSDGLCVSPDGKTIFTVATAGSNIIYGTWSEVTSDHLLDRKIPSMSGGNVYFIDDRYFSGGREYIPAHINYQNNKESRVLGLIESGQSFGYDVLACFESIPIVVGVSKNKLILGSLLNKHTLAEFNIPTELDNYRQLFFDNRKKREDDRFGNRYFGYRSARAAYADDNRKLAVFITSNHLAVVPLGKSDLNQTHPLNFSPSLPVKMELGSTFEIQVPQIARSSGAEFFLEDNEAKIEELIKPDHEPSPGLRADGEKGQSAYFVGPISAFLKRRTPYQIKIGEETMTVIRVEPDYDLIRVKRTSDIEHSVSETLVFLDEPVVHSDLASYQDGTIRFTPTIEQIGKRNLVLRAKLGSESRSWFWPLEVVSNPTADHFDFYVQGIYGIPETQIAIVWGISKGSQNRLTGQNGQSDALSDEGILAIYDTKTNKILKQTDIPFEIDNAIYHPTGIYALTRNLEVRGSNPDLSATMLVRFDAESLQKKNSRIIGPDNFLSNLSEYHLFVQANKHLVLTCERDFPKDNLFGYGRNTNKKDYRLKIPSLEDSTPPTISDLPLDGIVETGLIKNGILWDNNLRVPKLLLYPHAFGKNRVHHSAPVIGEDGTVSVVRCLFDGPNSSFRTSPMWFWRPGLKVPGRNIVIKSAPEGLQVYSNFANHAPVLDPTQAFYASYDPRKPLALIDYPNQKKPEFTPHTRLGSETLCGNQVLATSLGKVFRVPLDLLPKEPENFAFEEKQNRFVIEAGKKTKVEYSADGAEKYTLRIYLNAISGSLVEIQEDYLRQVKVVEMESTDGKFELLFDVDKVADSIFTFVKEDNWKFVGRIDRPKPPTREEFLEAIKIISDPYKELTGKNPTTLHAIATAVVTANHKDGKQMAGLLHAYLVEVPAKTLLKKIEAR
jgi:hypothetical protein